MSHNENNAINVPIAIEDQELLPFYMTDGAVGADVKANLKETVVLPAGQSALIPTGIRVAIPKGYEIQVRPRSGLALNNQITVLNAPGTIDSDYRGEIKIILINHGLLPFTILHGMRIAQLVLAPVFMANFVVCTELETTMRNASGFGHTGRH